MQHKGNPAGHDPSAAGQRKAFLLAALERYERPLTAYAMRLFAGDLDRARDVVQHSFLKLCQQVPEEVEHKLAAWLYTVCRNRVLDELRAKRSHDTSLEVDYLDPASPDPADRAEKREFLKCLRKLMDKLPTGQRDVVDLWSHGFTTVEIAEILERQPGAVRVALHRGIKQLRREPLVATWLHPAGEEARQGDSENHASARGHNPLRASGSDPDVSHECDASPGEPTNRLTNGNARGIYASKDRS